jgi:hypothetical protein
MHNSGLPDRYRSDRNEFYRLEQHMKSIIDTALVPVNENINEVLAGCFEKFENARQTVQNNIPASYTPAALAAPTPARDSQFGTPKK